MLVLTRKESQSVVINKEIKVVVLEVIGNTVKIGIQAPHGVDIVRSELLEMPGQAQGA
ncbi:carbon storage regulator [Desulforamulus ferrireducens]|uniref:Translational regulator CsrA n=1 Tax=Desulforamulus ferrireducens TaxID=1833852 RepID=A0A1S6IYI6_9FIRM|nr:carbon storage regulator [Desulforamulus ferrireducens]AQS59843.1 carbon storage regulator [Desulforamulus ferrireducens]